MSDEEDDLSFGTSEESRERSRSPSVPRHRSVSPRKEEAQAGAGRGPDVRSHTPPRGSLAQRHSCERGERSKQHTSVKNALSPASRRNKASRSPSPRNGGGSKRHSEDSSPRNKKTGALRRDAAVSRSRSPEKARKTAAEEFHKQGHRGSSERREGPVGAEPSGKPTGRSGHAPLMSSVGGSSKQEHQHRNGRRGHERKTRREDADSRNGPTAHTHRDHEDYGRYGGGGTPHTKEERSTGRPRRDRDERSNRDELPARHGHGTDHHPSSRSRHEVNRRPPSGYERHQQGSSLPMREAHDSFAPSNRSERDRQQRPLKRPRDVDVEGNSRSQRRGVSGPPSLAPPPPPRQAGLPPPPPVPSSAANGSTQQVSNRSDEHRSNKDESSQQGSSARRRRTGWEPAKSTPQPVHPAEALRSMPMPETREGGSGVGMSNHDLPGPPPMMPPPGQGPPPPAQPPAKDFGLSGVLAAETKRNEGGHIQKYAEPADAAIPGPGWRLYVYKGDQSSGKDCSCGPPIRLYRGNQTFWTLGKDKRVCHILAMHPSTSREHVAVQFRRTVKGEITPYVIDLDSSNGTYLRNQAQDVADGVHGGGYDKLDAGRYYRIYSGDVIRLGESQRDYVFIVDDSNHK